MIATTTLYGPSSIDPGEWMWVGNFYQGSSDEGYEVFADDMEELARQLAKLVKAHPESELEELFEQFVVRHANGGCASCGAHFAYGSVFFSPVHSHGPDLDIIAIGHECASNLFGLENLAAKQKKEVSRLRKVRKIKAEFEAQLEADPELAAAFELSFEGSPVDHPKDGTFLTGTGAGIVYDINRKGRRYGSISERQAELVKKIAREHTERQERREVELEAKADVPDVPEGRVEVTGTIISTKWVDGYRPDDQTLKMLVESEEGWRIWGTCPTAILEAVEYGTEELKGSKVRFTAAIEPSKDDRLFGFYKRPTKPELVEAAKTQTEEE